MNNKIIFGQYYNTNSWIHKLDPRSKIIAVLLFMISVFFVDSLYALLGIFLGFLFGYMLFGVQSIQMNSILIGSFIIILTGVIDDIKPLDAKTKLIGQIIAVCIVIFYGNILLNKVTLFGLYINFGILSYPLTVLFILGCINIINLIEYLLLMLEFFHLLIVQYYR